MASAIFSFITSMPSRHKQVLIATVVFVILCAFFVSLAVMEFDQRRQSIEEEVYPRFIVALGTVATGICREAQFALSFVMNQNDVTDSEYAASQESVNAAYSDSFELIQDNKLLHEWDSNFPLSKGATVMTEQGLGGLLFVRSQLNLGNVEIGPQTARQKYMDTIKHVVLLMNKCAHMYNRHVDFSSLVRANTFLSISSTFIQTEAHATQYRALKEAGAESALVLAELRGVLYNLMMFQVIVECLLKPVMDLGDMLLFSVKTVAYNLDETITFVEKEATNLQVLPSDVAFMERDSFAALEELLISVKDGVPIRYYGRTSYTIRLVVYILFSSITFACFLISFLEFLYLRFVNVKASMQQQHNVSVMHDVLVRVSEYVHEIASFSLNPKPPAKTMHERRTAIVEMQLEHLVGSLRAIVPSLPPLLFPARLRHLAEMFSEVKDPATMVLTAAPRENLSSEKLTLQTFNASNDFLAPVEERTDLQEHIRDVALLYVSLTAFHDLRDENKKKFTSEFFQKVVSIIEECVYQHGGVMHSVAFDKVVAVWNGTETMPNFCTRVTTCALTLSNRLTLLRNQKRLVRENFPVQIAVVGGTVNIGVFGCEDKKTLSFFGPPVLRGMFAAQANSFHNTTVACDDYVRNAVYRTHLCKPIELIPTGGCVHQVLHESTTDDAELEVQLAAYSKAFDLFEKKFYKGSLRAFREYTKVYGYDSSVERIQALITGMQ